MKVLLTVHQFFPDHTTGTEVLTYKVAKELQRKGHEVLVFTASPTKELVKDELRFDRYQYDGIPVERFYHGFVPMGGQTDLMEMEYHNQLLANHFREVLRHELPDVVHFFHMRRLSSSPVLECIRAGLPAFYSPTDFWAICPNYQLWLHGVGLCAGPDEYASNCVCHIARRHGSRTARLISRFPGCLNRIGVRIANKGILPGHPYADMVRSVSKRREVVISRLNRLDAIFVPSRIMAYMLEKNGVDSSLIRMSPYGIDLDIEASPRESEPTARLQVGFIGTLSEHKGPHLLIEALRSVPALPLDLHIFGNPTEFPDYVAKLRKLAGSDPRISFRGTFDNKDLGHVFSKLDVLAVPSVWYENTPLVIYSAQACGCPVIGSDLGGISEVVRHEENGLLFPPGSAKDIAAVLLRLNEDRALLHRLAAHSKRPRSISDYVKELLDVYQIAIIARRKIS